jgi:NAD-dependent dihydropyrimidine dehydrogenase PreA subunit
MYDYYFKVQNKLPIREGEANYYAIGSNGASVVLRGDRVTFNHNICNGCGQRVKVCPLGII